MSNEPASRFIDLRSNSVRSGIADLAESAKPDDRAPSPPSYRLAAAPRADRRADDGEGAERNAGRRLRRPIAV